MPQRNYQRILTSFEEGSFRTMTLFGQYKEHYPVTVTNEVSGRSALIIASLTRRQFDTVLERHRLYRNKSQQPQGG